MRSQNLSNLACPELFGDGNFLCFNPSMLRTFFTALSQPGFSEVDKQNIMPKFSIDRMILIYNLHNDLDKDLIAS